MSLLLKKFLPATRRNFCQAHTDESSLHHLIGWVKQARRMKKNSFLNVSDGSSPKTLQVVCPSIILPENLAVGSAVKITGTLKSFEQPREVGELQFDHCELFANYVEILNPKPETSVINDIHWASNSFSMPDLGLLHSPNGLQWRHQLTPYQSIFRLRRAVNRIIVSEFDEAGYLEVDTPILTKIDCEGDCQQFGVFTDNAKQGSTVKLTGSAQLHLELLVQGLGKVFTMNQTFRAEPSHSRMHLAEFRMVEAESMQLTDVPALCDEIEALIKAIFERFLLKCVDQAHGEELSIDVALVKESFCQIDQFNAGHELQNVIDCSFNRVTFNEALNLLKDEPSRYDRAASGLNRSDELKLIEILGGKPTFLTHFPVPLKPFYAELDPSDHSCTLSVDLLFPGVGEVVGGSVRAQSVERLMKGCEANGTELAQWYANTRALPSSGPHGGFGIGFDRLMQFMFGIHNIRDVVPFPREINKIFL
ncbi:Asparaginyl-tRNA synthetase [Cichlidogyrus casuarinus]|uniref:Asparaginyl-tRNA synthetase n=1 Tax=Cichlidogyrus casuarinus TaxID=1844966 RepID=A0ABD2QN00_9PLAT